MKIVFTPDWFLTPDVLIETFSFIILFLFFYFSVKSYKLSKNKNSLYLGIGFLLIALAELATILTKFVLYYDTDFTQQVGQMVITYKVVNSVDIFYYIGFFFHKLFTLLGLYIIYRLPLAQENQRFSKQKAKLFAEKKSIGDVLLAIFFIFVSALFSKTFYYLFHLTALILLVLIINNYCKIYDKNKAKSTKILIIALSMLALSQVIFILSKLNVLYVIAQSIQLVSYIILLILIIRIMEYGRQKKKQDRHNLRYVGNYSRKRKN